MKIPVELSASEWDEVAHLANEKDNEFITEEEYVDLLMAVIGNKIRTRPVEGDELVISIRTPIYSFAKNPETN